MTLTEPLFLWGLLAVAIPIIVHLFQMRRYKKVYFSNVEYLEALQSETRKQSKLRRLLILAARILMLVFLVLTFARPVIPNRNNPLRTGSNDVSVFIDNSFSMENTDAEGTLLEKAKVKAREIAAAYQPSDRFQLLTNDMEGRQYHWLSREEFLLEVDRVSLSPVTRTLDAVLRSQCDFLNRGAARNKYAYLVSDFQSSVTPVDALAADSSVATFLVSLEGEAPANLFIDTVVLNAPVFYKGNSVAVSVTLVNDGETLLEKVPLTLYVNGRQRALASVDVAAQSEAEAVLHFTIDEEGPLDCRVETHDYPVTFDDNYYFTLNVSGRVRMLAIEGAGANPYLARLFEGDSAVRFTALEARQMDFSRVGENEVVLLDELPSLSSGMAQSLYTFMEEGGTVVLVPGADVDLNSYNAALTLFGAPQFEGRNNARVNVSRVDLQHALYRNVFDGTVSDMEMPVVTGYYRLRADGTALRESILSLATGDDYLLRTPCGAGSLYLFTAPLRDAHTDFVRQALFVPTLYNMALYSHHPAQLAVGMDQTAPIALGQLYDAAEGTLRLTGPGDYEEIPDVRRQGGRWCLVPHASVPEAGNYHMMREEAVAEGLSFNYSRRESRLVCFGSEALTKRLKETGTASVQVVQQPEKPLDAYLRAQMEGRPLWRWCLALALLMLAVETLLIRLPSKGQKKA